MIEVIIGKNEGWHKAIVRHDLGNIIDVARKANLATPSHEQRLHGVQYRQIVVDDDEWQTVQALCCNLCQFGVGAL